MKKKIVLFARLKLIKIILPLSLIGILLCGCVDLFAGQRPEDYPNTIWKCESPDITIIVDNNHQTRCEIVFENGKKEFDVLFSYGTGIVFSIIGSTSDTDFVFSGDCDFGEDKMVVHVRQSFDQLFHGKYDTLIFTKQ